MIEKMIDIAKLKVGDKVYYKPDHYGDEKWEITIIPDYSTGIDKETWWNEFKTRRSNINEIVDKDNDIAVFDEDDDNKDYINWGDAFSDQHIDWHRSDNVSI